MEWYICSVCEFPVQHKKVPDNCALECLAGCGAAMCDMHDSDERANSIARDRVPAMGGWWVDDVAEVDGLLEEKYNGVIVTLVSWDSGTRKWQCRLHVNETGVTGVMN